ncbi:hypothetical protein RND71_021773 [Anisodus tanguticus]|uniref:Uncharacterized protein n=1 Tax=Anisodus tanguticus TaxID=243964 RepID=A0AAE1VFJ6_9SOLA|nr:hypothetical protein RND71_021773 [Anisodus tanguticus]
MNDTDVSKQIQQMVRFIRQEAEEKANEISVSAEEVSRLAPDYFTGITQTSWRVSSCLRGIEPTLSHARAPYSAQALPLDYALEDKTVEFQIEKLQLVEAEKKKVKQEYERKIKQVEVRKKIEYSMQLNASRIKVLQAQDDVVSGMKESARKALLKISGDKNNNKKLLKGMIVQSLLRLKEPSVLLRCREMDVSVVKSVVEDAKREYAEKAKVRAPNITIDNNVYLPPPPSDADPHRSSCSGGVVLASDDGKIVCENTLDARLDVVFRQKLPEIRKQLFSKMSA